MRQLTGTRLPTRLARVVPPGPNSSGERRTGWACAWPPPECHSIDIPEAQSPERLRNDNTIFSEDGGAVGPTWRLPGVGWRIEAGTRAQGWANRPLHWGKRRGGGRRTSGSWSVNSDHGGKSARLSRNSQNSASRGTGAPCFPFIRQSWAGKQGSPRSHDP